MAPGGAGLRPVAAREPTQTRRIRALHNFNAVLETTAISHEDLTAHRRRSQSPKQLRRWRAACEPQKIRLVTRLSMMQALLTPIGTNKLFPHFPARQLHYPTSPPYASPARKTHDYAPHTHGHCAPSDAVRALEFWPSASLLSLIH